MKSKEFQTFSVASNSLNLQDGEKLPFLCNKSIFELESFAEHSSEFLGVPWSNSE